MPTRGTCSRKHHWGDRKMHNPCILAGFESIAPWSQSVCFTPLLYPLLNYLSPSRSKRPFCLPLIGCLFFARPGPVLWSKLKHSVEFILRTRSGFTTRATWSRWRSGRSIPSTSSSARSLKRESPVHDPAEVKLQHHGCCTNKKPTTKNSQLSQ